MKKMIGILILMAPLASNLAYAQGTCDNYARGAAIDYIMEKMDVACTKASAAIINTHDDVRDNNQTRIIYDLEVNCDDQRFNHRVIIQESDCGVLAGGQSDA
jgi:hypothetical protein